MIKLSFFPIPSMRWMSTQTEKRDKGHSEKGAKPRANNDPLMTANKHLTLTSIYIRFCGVTEEGLF
jgi:hypothetical protein